MTASATTYKVSPAYCVAIDVDERAQRSAMKLTPMKAAITIIQIMRPPIIIWTRFSMPGVLSSTPSIAVKPSTAAARCR